MVNPWIQYEAYGMKMTNNVIYDVWGAGLGVIGGYSVLVAHNSLYRCMVADSERFARLLPRLPPSHLWRCQGYKGPLPLLRGAGNCRLWQQTLF
jgi:hypothetical protein